MGMFGMKAANAGPIPMDAAAAAYKPSALDVGLQMLFGSGGPADAAERLREIHYANEMRPVQAKALQTWLSAVNGNESGDQPQAQAQAEAPADTRDAPTMIGDGLGAVMDFARNQPPRLPQLGAQPAGQDTGSIATAAGFGQAPAPVARQASAQAAPFDVYNLRDPRARRTMAGAAMFGLPGAKDVLEIAKASQPQLSNFNGWAVDTRDPQNSGRFYEEAPTKGARPVFDQNKNPVGWMLANGAFQSIEQASMAENLGKSRGGIVEVPQDDGSKVTMLGGDYFGWGGPGGGTGPGAGAGPGPVPGPGAGPLPAQVNGQPGSAPAYVRGPPAAAGGPRLGVSQTPRAQAEAQAAGTAIGAATAKAEFDYPAIADRNNRSIALIDGLIADKKLGDALGWKSKLPVIPESHRVDIESKIEQLNGVGFLQAFNDLKGAGQITELEGTKAENAIARIKRRDLSEDDYRQALQDLRGVLKAGIDRAQQRAGGASGGGASGGGQGNYPAAPMNAQQRRAGQVYQTPQGPLLWSGTGWRKN